MTKSPPPYTGEAEKRRPDFHFRSDFINIDQQGAPVYPRVVLEAKIACLYELETCKSSFISQNREVLFNHLQELFAKEISCSTKDIVLMRNSLQAMYQVLAMTGRKQKGLIHLQGTEDEPAMATLKRSPTFRCKVFDYRVESFETITAEIEHLDHQSPVIVDLAPTDPARVTALHHTIHALRERGHEPIVVVNLNGIGLIDFSIEKGLADIYMGSTASWWYSGSPYTILYIKEETYRRLFVRSGLCPDTKLTETELTRVIEGNDPVDYPGLCAIKAADQYIKSLSGHVNIREYHNDLAAAARQYLLDAWDVRSEGESHGPVFLVPSPFQPPENQLSEFIAFMKDQLRTRHLLLVGFVVHQGLVQLRLSAAIYLDLGDFQGGKERINDCISEWHKFDAKRKASKAESTAGKAGMAGILSIFWRL